MIDWQYQLENDIPLSIPLYNGDNWSSEDFKLQDILPGVYYYETNIKSFIEDTFIELLKNARVDEKKFKVKAIYFKDSSTDIDAKEDVYIQYDLVYEDGSVYSSEETIIFTIPKVVNNRYFLIGNNKYSIAEELITIEDLYCRDKGDHKVIVVSVKDGTRVTLSKYFDGTSIVTISYYKQILDSFYLKDLDDKDLEYQANGKVDGEDVVVDISISFKHLDAVFKQALDINIKGLSTKDVICKLFEVIDSVDADNIQGKRVLSTYELLCNLIKENINFIISTSVRLKKDTLICSKYENLLHKLYGTYLNRVDDINPLMELSSLRKLKKNGIHGIKQPTLDIRDYQETNFNYIDPIETPESQELGLTVYRSLGSSYNLNGYMTLPKYIKQDPKTFNFPASEIPFMQHNDSIRCNMSCSHIKQSVPNIYNNVMYYSTGIDRLVYDLFAPKILSEEQGIVVEVSESLIRVRGERDIEYPIIQPAVGNSRTHDTIKPRVEIGQEIPKGYNLINTCCYNDGYLTLGTNVLIAWLPYMGLTYEDSTIISESLANRMVASKGITKTFKLSDKIIVLNKIPKVGDVIKAGDLFLEYHDKNKTLTLSKIFVAESKKIVSNVDGVCVRRYNNDEGDILIDINVQHKIEVGDKISYSSAAKCIVAKILPDSEMPKTHDGRTVDVIYNPLGIPSRMNLSQLIEAAMGMLNVLMHEHVFNTSMSKGNLLGVFRAMNKILKSDALSKFIKFIDKSDNFDAILSSICKHFVFELKTFDTTVNFKTLYELYKVLGLTKYFDPYLGKNLYLPREQKWTKLPVFYGYTRILQLKHIVAEKSSANSIDNISDMREKPQKIGEMEHLALEANHAFNFINEIALIKSNDKIGTKLLRNILEDKSFSTLDLNQYTDRNPTFDKLKVFMEAVGIKIE